MRYLFVFIILFFAGCSTKVPPVKEYRIKTKTFKISKEKSKCKNNIIKLSEPFSPNSYKIKKMYYSIDGFEDGVFNQSAWSEPIYLYVYKNLLNSLRQSELFKSVENYLSVANYNYIMEVEINDFKQYFKKDLKSSYVVVDLTLTLIDKKNYNTVFQQRFYQKIESIEPNAKAGVEALNVAFELVLKRVIKSLSGVCE
jgi:ABC-type uncharacterized transport system auxiliary subunit